MYSSTPHTQVLCNTQSPTRPGGSVLPIPATPDFLPPCFDNFYPGVFVLCRDDRAGSIQILIYPHLHKPWS